MDQEKVAYAQQRAREQGAKTYATPEKIEEVAQAIGTMAGAVEAGSTLEHHHGGVLNASVFDYGYGPSCRIQCTTRSGRQLTIQVALA